MWGDWIRPHVDPLLLFIKRYKETNARPFLVHASLSDIAEKKEPLGNARNATGDAKQGMFFVEGLIPHGRLDSQVVAFERAHKGSDFREDRYRLLLLSGGQGR